MNRRSLITGLVSLVAAPAIVRVGSLMQIKGVSLLDPAAELERMRTDLIYRWVVKTYPENWVVIEMHNEWPPVAPDYAKIFGPALEAIRGGKEEVHQL